MVILAGRVVSVYVAKSYDAFMRKLAKKNVFKDFSNRKELDHQEKMFVSSRFKESHVLTPSSEPF